MSTTMSTTIKSKSMKRLTLAAAVAIAVPFTAGLASAAPLGGAAAISKAAPGAIQPVYYGWRGGWRGGGWGWRGGGWGWGVGAGVAAGALIGGALAAPYYYGGYYPQPYYAPGPGYYAAPYGGDVGDDGVAYCMQRYRSYNPNTGTFMGNDGRPHPCP